MTDNLIVETACHPNDALMVELVQVAAVAVAAIEDALLTLRPDVFGPMDRRERTAYVLTDVEHEREAQEQKWGPQHHSLLYWLGLLGEEVGEACKVVIESQKSDAHVCLRRIQDKQ